MFDVPIDATYAWLGIAVASVAALGVAATLPAAPPPDAAGVALTIDAVADGEYPATAEHGIVADRIRITAGVVVLSTSGGGTARATLQAPRITPVPMKGETATDERLRRVLSGVPPETAFEDRGAFRTAAETARTGPHEWHAAPDRIRIRQVHWGEIRVTLVG